MTGYGPAADLDGDIFIATGNSNLPLPKETLPPVSVGPSTYLSDSVVRLTSDFKVSDWFTPSDRANGQHNMDLHDRDLGSGGRFAPVLRSHRALPLKAAIAAGKTGEMYLVDRASLGKLTLGHKPRAGRSKHWKLLLRSLIFRGRGRHAEDCEQRK